MIPLALSRDQAAILKEYLERVLSDLSVEIAGTDRLEYRQEIKEERRLLQGVLAQLAGALRPAAREA